MAKRVLCCIKCHNVALLPEKRKKIIHYVKKKDNFVTFCNNCQENILLFHIF